MNTSRDAMVTMREVDRMADESEVLIRQVDRYVSGPYRDREPADVRVVNDILRRLGRLDLLVRRTPEPA